MLPLCMYIERNQTRLFTTCYLSLRLKNKVWTKIEDARTRYIMIDLLCSTSPTSLYETTNILVPRYFVIKISFIILSCVRYLKDEQFFFLSFFLFFFFLMPVSGLIPSSNYQVKRLSCCEMSKHFNIDRVCLKNCLVYKRYM